MAASATQNPPAKAESKSSKKKKVKTSSTEAPIASTPIVEATPSSTATDSNNSDGVYESPYIKELYKNIRNVNKKITNASKVDNVLAENPGKSLDDLVAERKINADQKTQILNKPRLQASLAQLEEQIAQYKKFDEEYRARSQAEKAGFEKTFTDKAAKELELAVASARGEAEATALKEQKDNLLLLSQFLKLAAIRRGEDEATELEESKALEGLLAQVYAGDASAVAAMLSLIQGTNDTITSIAGEPLTVTYADIQAASLAQIVAVSAAETDGEQIHEVPAIETAEHPVETDPTIANAGLTEMNEPVAAVLTNGHNESIYETQGIPQNSGFGDGSANAAAEANWDNSNDLSTSQEWVEIPRDANETDNGVTATPAAPSNVQSWADDQPDSPVEKQSTLAANNNDGFQEIQRNRGGRGNSRGGRGRNDGFQRGRGGFRGDGYRGRGRGGPRGGARNES